ncbi:RNA-binding domain-containing protein [Delitschia confertaspora ATCC 74209]|uniref:Multiple RNA-binding domain-containing protein 1 n=1 Tax=Delitschia confertaspora ATCC 74209 TaxID=1513339 RepID=A0A9P4JZM2_9PLEO|nr:RNA-binding domain-containing protein [Delitschia confertaspora ATCC 74209]
MESSRIFVRGLPPKFTDDEFRKHFSRFPVTDAKFFPQRRIGYVGYKSPEDAASAVKYFNKTFIRMSKIFVEIARPISDENLPKSRRDQKNQRNAHQTDDYIPPPKENLLKRKRPENETEQDPKLKEFLDVMQPPSKLKSWANEETQPTQGVAVAAEPMEGVVVAEDESDDEYQDIIKKPRTSKNDSTTSVTTKPEDDVTEPEVKEGQMGPQDGQISSIPKSRELEGGAVTDDDWLRSRTNRVLDLEEDGGGISLLNRNATKPNITEPAPQNVESESAVDTSEKPEIQETEPSREDVSVEAQIRKTGRLYLRNLSYGVTEDDLRQHFSKVGSLDEVHVPMSKGTNSTKGFAFVQFGDHEHAVEAFHQNDGTVFQGRLLHILPGSAKRESKLDEFAISKLPLKKQKEIKRKTEAAQASFNWNSLYLNADAVMSSVADRLGISKAELLDPTSSDAAVKQAHAETHIISETKAYFAQHGVDLEAFKRSSKGDVAILVKNIPYGTKPDEVQRLFEEHGTLKNFLMPPSGMTAIIEFVNSTEAKIAFKSLAYRKIKDGILYLEKAPKDLFKEGFKAPVSAVSHPSISQHAVGKLSATDLLNEAPESQAVDTATLFVRNLNFSTTTERLREVFSPLDGFQSARVKTKVDPKRGVLSMGFGFLEFKNAAAAAAALKAMDGYNLDGHKLQIRASHKGADAAEERRKEDAAKKAAGTKLSVKNLPFEATKKDLRALFAPYGQLRSVRIAKKFDSSSRGFGFAEFTTKREAANALDALRNTHLLGRRLVIDFAETEPDDAEKELEKMQEKVGSQANKVALQRLTGGGRKKFNIAGNDDLDEA